MILTTIGKEIVLIRAVGLAALEKEARANYCMTPRRLRRYGRRVTCGLGFIAASVEDTIEPLDQSAHGVVRSLR